MAERRRPNPPGLASGKPGSAWTVASADLRREAIVDDTPAAGRAAQPAVDRGARRRALRLRRRAPVHRPGTRRALRAGRRRRRHARAVPSLASVAVPSAAGVRAPGRRRATGSGPVDAPGLAAVFVAGSTAFKLGPAAAELVREARRRGLHAHMGRVSTARRIALRELDRLHVV